MEIPFVYNKPHTASLTGIGDSFCPGLRHSSVSVTELYIDLY